MVFCNKDFVNGINTVEVVTILILIDGFLQCVTFFFNAKNVKKVTILILIDGFLQFKIIMTKDYVDLSHNPYFNRWFSAIYSTYINKLDEFQSQSLF